MHRDTKDNPAIRCHNGPESLEIARACRIERTAKITKNSFLFVTRYCASSCVFFLVSRSGIDDPARSRRLLRTTARATGGSAPAKHADLSLRLPGNLSTLRIRTPSLYEFQRGSDFSR